MVNKAITAFKLNELSLKDIKFEPKLLMRISIIFHIIFKELKFNQIN